MEYNLDSLIGKLGINGVDKLFTEYIMLLMAKGNLLNKVLDYVNEHGSINREELEKLLAGDLDDEGESFYT